MNKLKIACISDTHEKHQELVLPEADIIVHAGDFTNKGNYFKIRDFLQWFSDLDYKYKIFIMGNHELGTDKNPSRDSKLDLVKGFVNTKNNLYYLENSSISIEGMNFWALQLLHFFMIGLGMFQGAKK